MSRNNSSNRAFKDVLVFSVYGGQQYFDNDFQKISLYSVYSITNVQCF